MSAALEGLEFGQGARPVGTEQPGEAAIGEDFASRLAGRAVVRLVVRIANAENLVPAAGTGLPVAAVDGHALAEGSDFLWERDNGFGAEAVGPGLENFTGGCEEALPLGRRQFTSERDGRQLGRVQDLVRVGVADAAEQAWIGKGPLKRAVLGREGGGRRASRGEASSAVVRQS